MNATRREASWRFTSIGSRSRISSPAAMGTPTAEAASTRGRPGLDDLALEMAQIENFNISKYTSVIPRQAYEVPIEVARKHFEHGAVLEAILATMNGTTGEIITAGVGRAYVHKRASGEYLGGFAAEYEGHADPEGAAKVLRQDLEDMLRRRYRSDAFEFRFGRPAITSHRVRRSVRDSARRPVLAHPRGPVRQSTSKRAVGKRRKAEIEIVPRAGDAALTC